jgi:hypothetical protein
MHNSVGTFVQEIRKVKPIIANPKSSIGDEPNKGGEAQTITNESMETTVEQYWHYNTILSPKQQFQYNSNTI